MLSELNLNRNRGIGKMEPSKRYEREGKRVGKNERKRSSRMKLSGVLGTARPADWIGRVAEDRGDEPSVTARWVHPLFSLFLSGLFLRSGSTRVFTGPPALFEYQQTPPKKKEKKSQTYLILHPHTQTHSHKKGRLLWVESKNMARNFKRTTS